LLLHWHASILACAKRGQHIGSIAAGRVIRLSRSRGGATKGPHDEHWLQDHPAVFDRRTIYPVKTLM
jgi:hypothetical protein